ncbi:hypothetical protein HK103_000521 [Boothiomyces macroporosus]|uniref:VWFD domain-containing protein n=1 Tax=Boothiomyces macroporosus TaxID=261099 RepID=A0AAD5UBC2_9FUNG|nr:hypothetical protein HK103_000521 [Boothiomyces macroporosus]
MFKNLVLAALLGCASATALLKDLLEFDPPSLDIVDSVLGNKFKCRLKEKPSQEVKVYFEAAGFSFSNCFLTFPVEGYDQWQELSVYGNQVFEQRSDIDLDISARVFIGEEKNDSKYRCKRKYDTAGVCSSIGDPHFSCLNNVKVSHQGKGYYHLVHHDHLSVQAYHNDCFNRATCNHAIAIKYGSSIIGLDIRDHDKKKHIFTEITKNVDGIRYDGPTRADASHTVTLPCGSIIKLHVNYDTKNKWIDHTLHLAAGYEEIGGFCNRPTGKGKGLKCRDGRIVQERDVDVFANSWVVKDEENIFMGRYQQSTPPVVGVHAVCKIPEKIVTVVPPAPCNLPPYTPPTVPPPQITVEGTPNTPAVTETPSSPPTNPPPSVPPPSVPATIPPPPPDYEAQAKQHCQQLFNVPGCSKVCDVDYYVNACIADAKTCGSFVFAEAQRLAFMAECKITTGFMQVDNQPAVVDQSVQIQSQCGLGNHKCLNDCSGHGVCGVTGCRCSPTWGGADCSIDLTKLMSYNFKLKSYVKFTLPSLFCKAETDLPAPVTPPADNSLVYVQDQVKAVYGSISDVGTNATVTYTSMPVPAATSTKPIISSSLHTSLSLMASVAAFVIYTL